MSVSEIISGVLAIAAATFVLLAGVGVVRFPNLLARMHAATKAPVIGLLLAAVGAAVAMEEGRSKLLVTVAMVFVTVPVAGHLVARASYRGPGDTPTIDSVDELREALESGEFYSIDDVPLPGE